MSAALDKKLHSAIDELTDRQKKAVLGIVNVFAEESEKLSGHWEDKSFVAEMNDRYNEYKSGNAKLVSLEEAEKKARSAAAAQKLKSKKAG